MRLWTYSPPGEEDVERLVQGIAPARAQRHSLPRRWSRKRHKMTDKIACLRETIWTEEEVRELLVFAIENTRHWRREKAEESPEDNRNLKAAECLEGLETSVASVNPDLFAEYRVVFWTPYFDSSTALELIEVHSEVLRSVGFSLFPKNVNELVRDLLDAASQKAGGAHAN